MCTTFHDIHWSSPTHSLHDVQCILYIYIGGTQKIGTIGHVSGTRVVSRSRTPLEKSEGSGDHPASLSKNSIIMNIINFC